MCGLDQRWLFKSCCLKTKFPLQLIIKLNFCLYIMLRNMLTNILAWLTDMCIQYYTQSTMNAEGSSYF